MSIEPYTVAPSCVSTGYRHTAATLILPQAGMQLCKHSAIQFYDQKEQTYSFDFKGAYIIITYSESGLWLTDSLIYSTCIFVNVSIRDVKQYPMYGYN